MSPLYRHITGSPLYSSPQCLFFPSHRHIMKIAPGKKWWICPLRHENQNHLSARWSGVVKQTLQMVHFTKAKRWARKENDLIEQIMCQGKCSYQNWLSMQPGTCTVKFQSWTHLKWVKNVSWQSGNDMPELCCFMWFYYLCSAYTAQHWVVSVFITWNALMNYSHPIFFCFLFVIDSIHFILFITMLFIWHDFCYPAWSFINSPGCYYNLIWVICRLTFTVTWCITLIWCSAQHCVYNRNSMTARHKLAISNLIYFHQYLWIWYELCMCFRALKCRQLFHKVSSYFWEGALSSKPPLSFSSSK